MKILLLKSNGQVFDEIPTHHELVEFILYSGWLFQRQEKSRTYIMVQYLEIT